MGVVLVPILEGKLETWKAWARDCMGSRKEELADFNRRYGLTQHKSWLAETPGGPFVIALHEGPGSDELMPKLAASQNDFDVWFRDLILEVHGMDITQPPPGPMPELWVDSGS